MNAFDFVAEKNKADGYGVDKDSVFEALTESDTIYSEVKSEQRWWNSVFRVAKVGDELIGYMWAEATGDNNAGDLGWEPDADTICFCESFDVTVTKYRKKSL